MVRSQPFLRYIIIPAVLLLSACGNMNDRHHASNTSTVKAEDVLLIDSQDSFELLLNSLKAQSPQQESKTTKTTKNGKKSSAVQVSYSPAPHKREVKSRILQQYDTWKGVRYRLGGDSKRGIDCSAFVRRTFLEQFGLELPRSTYEQQGVGKHIARDGLRTGDLVLFKTSATERHIGIYIGNNQFVHASTRKGVIISSLDNPYWKPRYRGARRILTSS